MNPSWETAVTCMGFLRLPATVQKHYKLPLGVNVCDCVATTFAQQQLGWLQELHDPKRVPEGGWMQTLMVVLKFIQSCATQCCVSVFLKALYSFT